jgi:hypothetical protein
VGPFGDADRTRALADVDSLALGRLLTQRRIDTATGYWVYLAPFASRAAADKRARANCGLRDSGTCSSSSSV